VVDQYCVHSPDEQLGQYFQVDLEFTDTQTHGVSFYVLDYDANYGTIPRVERFDVYDACSGALLASHQVDSFQNGKYVVWDISGHVLVNVVYVGGSWNSVMSGVFIDPAF